MNILLITYQGNIAGSTNSISYLAKGLGERGHNVYVGCPAENLLYRLVENMPVTRIPMTFKGRFDSVNMKQIRDAVLKYDIQLINAQSSLDRYTVAFAKWRYKLPVKIVHTRRQRPLSMGGWLQNWFYTSTTSKIVAVSGHVKTALIKMGLPKEHIAVINNGTPPEKYKPHDPQVIASLKAKYKLSEGDFVVGCVARHKQQEQLLEALVHIEQPLKLFLVGLEETPEYKEITSRYTAAHQVFYTGIVSGEEALAHYGLLDIKVLPSIIEGLSQSLLESMYQGVPVIATRASGNIDLIKDGENGLFFEEGDVKGLAKTIQRLRSDEKLYEQLKVAGERTAKVDFSIDKTVSGYEKLFQSIIDEG